MKAIGKKIEILKVFSNGKVYTYYNLSKVLKTNYETIKKNCNFLELLNLIEVNRISKEEVIRVLHLTGFRILPEKSERFGEHTQKIHEFCKFSKSFYSRCTRWIT